VIQSLKSSRFSLGWILVPILALAILAAVLAGFAFYGNSSHGPFPYYGWLGGPFFGWFFFIPLIFIAFFAFRWFWWRPWGRGWYGYDDPAMETLRQRFARGEITKEQYEQMAKDLEQ
jgi:putative membrane protein